MNYFECVAHQWLKEIFVHGSPCDAQLFFPFFRCCFVLITLLQLASEISGGGHNHVWMMEKTVSWEFFLVGRGDASPPFGVTEGRVYQLLGDGPVPSRVLPERKPE